MNKEIEAYIEDEINKRLEAKLKDIHARMDNINIDLDKRMKVVKHDMDEVKEAIEAIEEKLDK
ncbi:MAG: hypothetical protein RLP12_07005 [Ekhidna sp.]